jgi:hypothetical protein
MKYLILVLTIFLLSCEEEGIISPIETALSSDAEEIQTVMKDLDIYEVQIRLSTISRIKDSVVFEDHDFQVDDNMYFYPASTVKLPASILALEKLNEEGIYGIDSRFFVEGDTLSTTFRKEIRDIFAVSSNDTYNRLFEFLSKDYINAKLNEKGLVPAQIVHRLESLDPNDLTTKPLIFMESDSTLTSTESMINKPITPLTLKNVNKGKGYYNGDELIEEPMDFSKKNYLPISTIHNMMKRIIYPESFSQEQQFNLRESDREFLINTMSIVPRAAGYDPIEFYDGYGKFFIYGDTKERIPDHIKIHNKVGYAYGYLTDCAFINDTKNNVQFILTATIHVNSDGIYNDDIYEYEEIGIPFLAHLGREIHTYLINSN